MSDVQLVDVTLRDGNQSLWGAVGLTTRMVRSAAPLIDRVGYEVCELTTSTQMATAVRYQREDPWERIRVARDGMPSTRLGFLTTGKRFISFHRTPDNLFELAFKLLVRNGISRFWIAEPMHDMPGAMRMAAIAKAAGAEDVVCGICYTLSPIHTDEYFAARAAEVDGCEAIDALYLKDPAGLLTPDRVRTLLPLLQRSLRQKRLAEIHSHCTTGLSPLTVLEAADLGVTTIHCAIPPLANGTSHPAADTLVRNLRARGHSVDVDLDAIAAAGAYLRRQARLKRLPVGAPAEYDEEYYRHTIPGGVMTTLARQLTELGKPELLPAVKEEAVHVRADLGWPIVVTPFAQYIVTQATLNVLSGERYSRVSDEMITLLLGEFGPLPGPVNEELRDRALSSPRARALAQEQEAPSLADLRARFGSEISDEELLLRAVMAEEHVDGIAARRGPSGGAGSLRSLLDELEQRPEITSFSMRIGGAEARIRRAPEPENAGRLYKLPKTPLPQGGPP